MKSFTALIIAAFLVATISATYRIRRIEVGQPEGDKSLGVVNGLRSCGGPGKVLQWRVEGCSGEGICKFQADGEPKRSELDIIPSEDASGLGFRFIVIHDGTAKTVYDRAIANSAVQGGQKYTISSKGGASKEHKGQIITAQIELYRVEDNNVEVCGEADFELV